MKSAEVQRALASAVAAARAAGQLMRRHLREPKQVNAASQHDIKLELDVRCQKLIERRLRAAHPAYGVLGEEGVVGNPEAPIRWVVDPIDGTVNFTYGLPHACVSIALQTRASTPGRRPRMPGYRTVVGVVYDPFCDELWTATQGGPAFLNGRRVRVSDRHLLREALVALGFAKSRATLERMLRLFNRLVHRVRKIRILGAAALSATYVASGRLDAYTEYGVRLWDIAAAGLIVECAGGEAWRREIDDRHTYEIVFTNGRFGERLRRLG
jgi:myo-inositol-1(or 4)-monophosphatase